MKTKIKILISILGIVMNCSLIFGQIEQIPITKSITLDKIYAGILSSTNFSVDSAYAPPSLSLRVGAVATWKPAKWFAISGLSTFDYTFGANPLAIAQMWMTFTPPPMKNLTLQVGYMGTLPTQQRPLPPTANGHFETWSEAQIPGQALNVKINYDGDIFKSGIGVAIRNNQPEYSAMVGITSCLKISGWYSTWNDQWGIAMTTNTEDLYDVLVIKKDVIANIICIHLPWNLDLYSDNGYDLFLDKLVRSETGILLNFDSEWIKGLFGLGYCIDMCDPLKNQRANQIKAYLFVHL